MVDKLRFDPEEHEAMIKHFVYKTEGLVKMEVCGHP